MIKNGKIGSFNVFWKGLMISSHPYHREGQYDKHGDDLLNKGKGIPILTQIGAYRSYCELVYQRKLKKKGIRRSDHRIFLYSLLALMRLNGIENDYENGYLIMEKKSYWKQTAQISSGL